MNEVISIDTPATCADCKHFDHEVPNPFDRCLSMKQTSEIIGRSKKTIGIMEKGRTA